MSWRRAVGRAMRAAASSLVLVQAACQTTGPEEDPVTQTEAEGGEAAEEIRDGHRERFAAYEVEAKDLPKLTRYTIKVDSADPILIRHSWFELELVLGRRVETEMAGRFRTTSRYRLISRNSIVEAESIFAREDLTTLDLVRATLVCHDEQTGEVFLFEEHSWSVQRMILLHPAPGGTMVSYVRLPFLRPYAPAGSFAILGIRGGMIYARQDGVIYGYPLRDLLELEDLSYAIG